MNVTLTQSLALLLLGLALARSSQWLLNAMSWLNQAKSRSLIFQTGYAVCAAIAALPDTIFSAKAIEFALMLVKA